MGRFGTEYADFIPKPIPGDPEYDAEFDAEFDVDLGIQLPNVETDIDFKSLLELSIVKKHPYDLDDFYLYQNGGVDYRVEFAASENFGVTSTQVLRVYRKNITSSPYFGKKTYNDVKNKYESSDDLEWYKKEKTPGKGTWEDKLKQDPDAKGPTKQAKRYFHWGFYEIYEGRYDQYYKTDGTPTNGGGHPLHLDETNIPGVDVSEERKKTATTFDTKAIVDKYLLDHPDAKTTPGMKPGQTESGPEVAPDPATVDFVYDRNGQLYYLYFNLNNNMIEIEAYRMFKDDTGGNIFDAGRIANFGTRALFEYYKGEFEMIYLDRWKSLLDFDNAPSRNFAKIKNTSNNPNYETVADTQKLTHVSVLTKNIMKDYFATPGRMIDGQKVPYGAKDNSEFIVLQIEMKRTASETLPGESAPREAKLWYTFIALNEDKTVEKQSRANRITNKQLYPNVTRNTVEGQVSYYTLKHEDVPANLPMQPNAMMQYMVLDSIIAPLTPVVKQGFNKNSIEEWQMEFGSYDYLNPDTNKKQKVAAKESLGEPVDGGVGILVGLSPVYPPAELEVNFKVNKSQVPTEIEDKTADDKTKKDYFLEQLKTIITYLYFYPQVKVNIIGHTSAEGEDGANLTLSTARAKSVRDYLKSETVTAGISGNQKSIKLTDASFGVVTGVGETGSNQAALNEPDPLKKEELFKKDRKIVLIYDNK